MEKIYEHNGLKVKWNSTKCIHAGNCVRGLPNVFKPKDKPWIQLANEENKEKIINQVNKCPSGAISIKE